MPIPLILGGLVFLLGGTSVVVLKEEHENYEKAKDRVDDARRRNDRNLADFKEAQSGTQSELKDLCELKLATQKDFQRFSETYVQIKNKPPKFNNLILSKELPEFDFDTIRKVSLEADEALVMLRAGAIGAGSLGLGGMAIGSTLLGLSTLGIGILLGGAFLHSQFKEYIEKADDAYSAMLKNEREIKKNIEFFSRVRLSACNLRSAIGMVNGIYDAQVTRFISLVNQDNDWNSYDTDEKLLVENNIFVVSIVNQLINTSVSKVTKTDNQGNPLEEEADSEAVELAIRKAKSALTERGLFPNGSSSSASKGVWGIDY
jgi:hypothetical protein